MKKIKLSESQLNLLETKLCARGKAAAKRKFDVWPSAYASAYAVKVCKGQVKDSSGKKKTASGYRKKSGKPKNEIYDAIDEVFEQLKTGLKEGGHISEDYNWESLDEAEYKGKKVKLNKPFRQASGGKKFAVYVKTPKGNVKKVRFGAQGYKVKNNDPKARKNFRDRHNCDQKKDKTTAGYWSCNIGRYAKSLSLSSSRTW
jgi:hypothetical protein